MLDRVQLKYEAKAITKNAKESAYVFTLIYLAIGLVLDGIDYLVSGSPQTEVYGYLADYMPEAAVYLRGTEPILHLPAPAVWFVSIVISLVTAVLGAGYILYTMNVRKGLITPYTTLFDGFLFAGKIILLEIVQYIFVFLWSLLFIIPGIIAGYRYRFALYNLCENPEMGVMEALNMSKAQTRGHKWELFVLDLSFLGWELLCTLPMLIGGSCPISSRRISATSRPSSRCPAWAVSRPGTTGSFTRTTASAAGPPTGTRNADSPNRFRKALRERFLCNF